MAATLSCAGVSALLTVALEGTRDPAQLQRVEFGRGFGNDLSLRITTPNIGDTVLKQIVSSLRDAGLSRRRRPRANLNAELFEPRPHFLSPK